MQGFLDGPGRRVIPVPVEIKKSTRSGAIVIELSGKFDIEQAQNFESNFNGLIKDKPQNVALDLNDVQYIDSSAIGSIIKALNVVKNYGGEMILFGMKPMILNVFKLAKLDNFFRILTPEEFNRKYPAV
ncbi:MAG: STAS domain-containing protein [Spirochaetia bacterium]|nr:STAS domain-containing protein [Spirochaetia bacterium]